MDSTEEDVHCIVGALLHGHLDTARFLVSQGALPDFKSTLDEDRTALSLRAEQGSLASAQFLDEETSSDIETRDSKGYIAAENNAFQQNTSTRSGYPKRLLLLDIPVLLVYFKCSRSKISHDTLVKAAGPVSIIGKAITFRGRPTTRAFPFPRSQRFRNATAAVPEA